MIRTDGTWAIEPNFDAAQPLQEDKALVRVGNRAGVVDVATGRLVTQTRFDDVCSLGRGIVGVMLGGKMGAIDANGHWLSATMTSSKRHNTSITKQVSGS